jgi:hypothetical protein
MASRLRRSTRGLCQVNVGNLCGFRTPGPAGRQLIECLKQCHGKLPHIWRRDSRGSRRNSARYNKFGLKNLNGLAALVYRPAEKDYRAAIGSRARWRNFNDFAFHMEYISGASRRWPIQLSPGPDNAASEWRTTLNIETHRDRGSVPTARCQSIEECAFRGLLVCVKRLRIELNCERLDLGFVKRVCLAGKALSDMQIVKIEAA